VRPDETWHRLLFWTYDSAHAERLAAQLVGSAGFRAIDPSHPLGGPDGGVDATCERDGQRWTMAVYFPRGPQKFSVIREKVKGDLQATRASDSEGTVIVTNQQLSLGEREVLNELTQKPVEILRDGGTNGQGGQPSVISIVNAHDDDKKDLIRAKGGSGPDDTSHD
jgi:hypothetical protein